MKQKRSPPPDPRDPSTSFRDILTGTHLTGTSILVPNNPMPIVMRANLTGPNITGPIVVGPIVVGTIVVVPGIVVPNIVVPRNL